MGREEACPRQGLWSVAEWRDRAEGALMQHLLLGQVMVHMSQSSLPLPRVGRPELLAGEVSFLLQDHSVDLC